MGTEQIFYEQVWSEEEEQNFLEFEKTQHSTDVLLEQYNKDINEVDVAFEGEDNQKIREMINYCEISDNGNEKNVKSSRTSLFKITQAVLREEREKNGGYKPCKKVKRK